MIKITYLPTYLPRFLTWKVRVRTPGETRGVTHWQTPPEQQQGGHPLSWRQQAQQRWGPQLVAPPQVLPLPAARRRATREEQLVGWSGGALWNPPKAQALAAGLASGGYLPTLTLAQPRHPHTYLPTFLGYLTQAM